jgi:hypothetical protein
VILEKTPHTPVKLLYIKGYLYVVFLEEIGRKDALLPFDKYVWPVLFVYDKNLNQIERLVLDSDESKIQILFIGQMSFDGKNLYLVGNRYEELFENKWVIYSVSISIPENATEQHTFNSTTETSNVMYSSNIMYLIIGLAVTTAIVSILIVLVRRKLSKISQIS